MIRTLTVITVVARDGLHLATTIDSLLRARSWFDSFHWIVVTKDLDVAARELLEMARLRFESDISVLAQSGAGIYQAMNQGLEEVKTEYFIFINAGDVLLDTITMVGELPASKVHCFGSQWHDENGRTLGQYKPFKPISLLFGRGPHHQGMLFPKSFSSYRYQEEFEIAGDLDLKLRLHRKDLLVFNKLPISSSLRGGLSGRALRLGEVIPRLLEQRLALAKYFKHPWLEFLCFLKLLRFIIRSL